MSMTAGTITGPNLAGRKDERHEYDLRRADRIFVRPEHIAKWRLGRPRLPEPQRRNFQMAQPLTTFAASKTTHLKFEHINAKSQRKITTQATAVRKFGDERNRWESPAGSSKDRPTGRAAQRPVSAADRTQENQLRQPRNAKAL